MLVDADVTLYSSILVLIDIVQCGSSFDYWMLLIHQHVMNVKLR
jgi:hypothetical protein